MTAINTIQDLQKLVMTGFSDWHSLGCVHTHEKGDLVLFNYTAEAQYRNGWNAFERMSRGLILSKKTGEVVARSFDKFFNFFEGGRVSSGHIVTALEKIDGSMGVLYRDNGYKIATRGSFESEQALWATEFLNKNYDLDGLDDALTLIFEIVYPENRIIVDYGERKDLVLLAVRNRHTGCYLPFFPDVVEMADKYHFVTPTVYNFNSVNDIMAMTGQLDANTEGWVVEFSDGLRFKFKGDRYLELARLLNGLTYKKAVKAVLSNVVDEIRHGVPEEFLVEFDGWVEEARKRADELHTRIGEVYNLAPKDTRKDFAVWVNKYHRDMAKYLFSMLDDKDIYPLMEEDMLKDS